MRSLLPLAALAVLLAVAPAASAQVQAESSLAISGLSASSTNETVAVLPFQVEMTLSRFPCLGEGADIRVALTATAAPEGNATATVQPDTLTFTVPPTQGVSGYSQTQSALVTLRPATAGAGNYTAKVHAEFAGVSGCAMATAEGAGTDAEAPVSFLAPRGAAVSVQGPAAPGPGLALLALALAAAAVVRRLA